VPQGVCGRRNPVTGPRTWRWSRSRGRAWPSSAWIDEWLDTRDARWFSRVFKPAGAGGPPIVFVHGVVVSGDYFWPIANALVGEYAMYVPDLPGTGRSRLRTGGWSIAEQAAALAGWLDAHHLAGMVLVANSLGAQVVTELAVTRPDLAAALVLVGPTTDPGASGVIGLMLRGLRDLPRERLGLWRIWLRDLVRTGPFRGLRHLRQGLRDPQLDRLGEISVPVVVVGGESDPIAPPEWIAFMADEIEDSRGIVVPGAPHAMNYSSPRDLARIIRVVAGRIRDS
jgi:pimeloyl-ACP methyl ester carboxylesterase